MKKCVPAVRTGVCYLSHLALSLVPLGLAGGGFAIDSD